jgi:hypothetical protein
MAAIVADEAKRNPAKMEPLKAVAYAMPRLAFHLIPHFPGLLWLKDTATQAKKKKLKCDDFVEAELRGRDALEGRWNETTATIKKTEFSITKWPPHKLAKRVGCAPIRNCPPGTRAKELIACAKFRASASSTILYPNQVKQHFREQRIEALASVLADVGVALTLAAKSVYAKAKRRQVAPCRRQRLGKVIYPSSSS